MADKLTYITNDGTQNYPFRRLQLVIGMFGHLTTPLRSLQTQRYPNFRSAAILNYPSLAATPPTSL